MKKFIQKIAAMAISGIMCLTSAIPATAATAEDYVPTIELNAVPAANDLTTGTAENYGSNSNGMTIKAVADASYTELASYDTSVLTAGRMGGVNAPTSATFNNSTYNFSHFEYVTSVRNYVASYNNQFEFYVDPPMTIYAVYTTGTPTPPEGPVVGMYKDPDIKTVTTDSGAQVKRTFFYCSEAANGTDLSGVNPTITFGRSALDESTSGNSETFSAQAKIGNAISNCSYQFIAASGILNNGPIDFDATATSVSIKAQIKTWNFSSTAFDGVSNKTASTVNGLSIDASNGGLSNYSATINSEEFTKRIKISSSSYLSFEANKGDVIYIYGKGNNSSTASKLSLTNAVITDGSEGNLGVSGGSGAMCKCVASSTGTVKITTDGKEMNIFCIKVNPYEIKENGSVETTPKETVTQSFTITPEVSGVKVGNTEITNNSSLTLNKGDSYTVTAPSGYEVVSVNGISGNTFTADTDNATIAIVLKQNSVTAAITVDPSTAAITINGTTYNSGDNITLTVGDSYTVAPADTASYTLTSVNGASRGTFTAAATTTAVAVVLTKIETDNSVKVYPTDTGYDFSTATGTGTLTTDSSYGGAYYQVYTGTADAPELTTPTSNNYVEIKSDSTAYIYDNYTDITKLFMPMTATVKGYTTGTVTISGTLTQSVAANKWSLITLMDDSDNEIIALRVDGSGNYALATPATSDYNYSSTTVANGTSKISYNIRFDYDNNLVYLSINNGTEVSRAPVSKNGISKIVAVTAHSGLRNLTVGNITIGHSDSGDVPIKTGTISGTVTNANTAEKIAGAVVDILLDNTIQYSSEATGSSGAYSISNVEFNNNYSVHILLDGFVEFTQALGEFIADMKFDIALTPETPSTITQTINISPVDKTVTIDGKEVTNGQEIALSPSTEYTITPPIGYSVTTPSTGKFTTGTTDGTTSITLTSTTTEDEVWHKYYGYDKDAENNGDTNDTSYFTGTTTAGNALESTFTIDGKEYTITKRSSSTTPTITFEVPEGYTATFYIAERSSGSSRTLTLKNESGTYEKTQSTVASASTSTTPLELMTFDSIVDSGKYTFTSSGNIQYGFVAVKLVSSGPVTTGKVTVNVTNKTTGSPVTGATISGITGVTFEETSTGVYTASKVEPGTYTITASKNRVSGSTTSFAVEAGGKYTKDIVLEFTNGSIAITVSDGTNPITNASVTASGLTFAGSSGVYTASNVTDGTYTITVTSNGETKTLDVTVTDGSAEERTVAFMDTHTEAKSKIQEYLNIILARDVAQPKWNTESSRFNTNNWHYVNGAMVTALLDLYEATGNTTYSDFAVSVMNLNIESDGSFNTYSKLDSSFTGSKAQLDGVREMTDFDRLYILTNDSRYNTAADYVYTNVLSPDTRIASDDAYAPNSFSHKANTYDNQIWLDGFFMAFPFYMQYGVKQNDQTMIDDVYTQFYNLYNVSRDATTKLYYHGFNGNGSDIDINGHTWAQHSHSDSFWLRAMAWLAMSYVDTLEFMPEGTNKDNMKTWFNEYMKAVVSYQDSTTGMWRQVVDAGDVTITANGHSFDNYFETSGSAGMAAALMKGYRLGYLDESYYNAGVKAFDGICENKLYYNDTATSEIYAYSTNNTIDWITPWQVTADNNSGSENIGKYMILKDICRVAGLTSTSTTNYGDTIYRDGTRDYYLQEFRVDNDGKAIAPLLRAYSEVLIHENGGNKTNTLK